MPMESIRSLLLGLTLTTLLGGCSSQADDCTALLEQLDERMAQIDMDADHASQLEMLRGQAQNMLSQDQASECVAVVNKALGILQAVQDAQ